MKLPIVSLPPTEQASVAYLNGRLEFLESKIQDFLEGKSEFHAPDNTLSNSDLFKLIASSSFGDKKNPINLNGLIMKCQTLERFDLSTTNLSHCLLLFNSIYLTSFKSSIMKGSFFTHNYYDFCDFEDISLQNGEISGVFVNCKFKGLNNSSNNSFFSGDFIKCHFIDIVFETWASNYSTFIECTFENCTISRRTEGGLLEIDRKRVRPWRFDKLSKFDLLSGKNGKLVKEYKEEKWPKEWDFEPGIVDLK